MIQQLAVAIVCEFCRHDFEYALDIIRLRAECGALSAVENILGTLSWINPYHYLASASRRQTRSNLPIVICEEVWIPLSFFKAPCINRTQPAINTVDT